MMSVRIEVVPFVAASLVVGACLFFILKAIGIEGGIASGIGGALAAVLVAYMLYFFRDPARTAPADLQAVVSGADGHIANIMTMTGPEFRTACLRAGLTEEQMGTFLNDEVFRISIFLSLFDVHVNRAPIGGQSRFLGYFPGKHYFTFKEKSSDFNQHNSILIENGRTRCLFNQIVGPVCRRVVYWPDHGRAVAVQKGDPIGMMKFGSRLDLYFPKKDIELAVKLGDRVRAGETVIARLR
jgi:phosphatidylserine decarboxylase